MSRTADGDTLVAKSLQEGVPCLVAIGAPASPDAAPERLKKHVNVGLIGCGPDQLLQSLKKGFPAEREHAFALDQALALFGLPMPTSALRGCAKFDSDRTEDIYKVVRESANRLDDYALDLEECRRANFTLQVL